MLLIILQKILHKHRIEKLLVVDDNNNLKGLITFKDIEKIESMFKADLVLISAGFDAHRDDPLAGMLVTEAGFWKFTEILARYSWRCANGKILSVLEGGYNLNALADSVLAHLDCLFKH